MSFPRKMKVKRKNVYRVVKRLNLDCDMAGFFTGEYDGHKTDSIDNTVTFYFSRRNWWCPKCQEYIRGEFVTNSEVHETCGAYLGV